MTIRFNPPALALSRHADTFVHIATEMLAPEIAGELHVLEHRPHARTRLVLIVSGRQPVLMDLSQGFLHGNATEEKMRHAVSELLGLLPAHGN